jgi:hypothetical protein
VLAAVEAIAQDRDVCSRSQCTSVNSTAIGERAHSYHLRVVGRNARIFSLPVFVFSPLAYERGSAGNLPV